MMMEKLAPTYLVPLPGERYRVALPARTRLGKRDSDRVRAKAKATSFFCSLLMFLIQSFQLNTIIEKPVKLSSLVERDLRNR
jgi:hypothetical protein